MQVRVVQVVFLKRRQPATYIVSRCGIACMIFTHYHRQYTGDLLIVTTSISVSYIFYTFRKAYQTARKVTYVDLAGSLPPAVVERPTRKS